MCNPHSYRAHSHPSNTNMRVLRYFTIIFFVSVAINTPRFFETKLITETVATNASGTVELENFVTFDVTDLRRDPIYIRYSSSLLTVNAIESLLSSQKWCENFQWIIRFLGEEGRD